MDFFTPIVEVPLRVEGKLFFITHALIFAIFTLEVDGKHARINFIKFNFVDFTQF